MKKLIYPFLFAIIIGFTSCDELGDLIPDIDQVVTESYEVTIDANVPTGISDTVFINIEDYPEYQSYKENVSGYKLNKITYEILDYNAPEDLFFLGSIVATDSAELVEIEVGSISPTNLFDIANMGGENDMDLDTVAVNSLISWIEDPGNFNVKFRFGFENSDGSDYEFTEEDFGSTFTVKARLYLTIITGF